MTSYSITLFPQHAAALKASGISPEFARARGYVTVDVKGRVRELGITPAGCSVPGLLIPLRDARGSVWGYQYRPDKPRDRSGKPVKYETPTRQPNRLDVPPGVGAKLGDPAIPLWVTEGTKKADCAAERGLACVALLGVWSWRGSNAHGGKTAIADWYDVALNDRRVVLAFDSDVMAKASVRAALDALASYLQSKGARVEYCWLPEDEPGKTGLDDYLIRHDVGPLWALVHPDPPPVRETAPGEKPAASSSVVVARATVQPPPPLIARAPRILDLLRRDAGALGVVGEWTVVATVYLVATSRLLERQASLAVKGHSASGKSHAVAAVLSLFPPEALVVFTAMSERALVFSAQEYAHRTIVIYEATALRENDEDNWTSYLLRSLLSEGRLDYEVTVKDGSAENGFSTRRIVKQGPTNLIITTTKVRIHGENETRMLSVTTDDSQDQTRRVLAALADETERRVDLEQWQQLQRWLQTAEHRVTVPYASALAELISPVAVRLRRDFTTLLALVRAHAVLHQLTRARDAQGRITATLEDYDAVRGIVADVLAEGVASTVSETTRQTVAAIAQLGKQDGATASEVGTLLGLDKSAASRRLTAAAAAGYVLNLEDRRGRPGRWALAAPLPEDVQLLPTVDRLREVAPPPATADTAPVPATPDSDGDGCTVAHPDEDKAPANTDPGPSPELSVEALLYQCPICGAPTEPQRRGTALHPSLCLRCTTAELTGSTDAARTETWKDTAS